MLKLEPEGLEQARLWVLKWRGATRDFSFMFWIIANDCACLMILCIPRLPRKQIELWGIKSTSGNFRPYQIQTANIHFKNKIIIDPQHFKRCNVGEIRIFGFWLKNKIWSFLNTSISNFWLCDIFWWYYRSLNYKNPRMTIFRKWPSKLKDIYTFPLLWLQFIRS